MCLQDYQLARAALTTVHEVNIAGAGISQVLPKDESRIGFLLLGPNTGTLDILIGVNNIRRSLNRLIQTTTNATRYYDLKSIGYAVTDPILVNATSAMTLTIYEYSLPVDPESLKRLAATGKW